MEGLEAVVINFSVCSSIIDFRIDANTFKKEYIKSDRLINSKPNHTVEELSTSVQNFGAYSLCNHINFTDSGIPFLMTQNIRHNYIDWNIDKYVDDESHALLYKSHCKKGQVLVTMAGEYLGRVAVYDRYKVCSSNQAIAKVTLKPNLNPYIVSTFLNSKHGQNQINRFKTITGQPNINMSLIKSLKIPTFSDSFEIHIENLISESERKRNATAQQYQTAEYILLEAIGLNNFEPNTDTLNIKSYKDSFLKTGRLDAEYYQKKYENLLQYVDDNTNWEFLKNLTLHISNGNQPPYSENGEIKFFSQKWIGDKAIDYSFLDSENEPRVDRSFFDEEKNKTSLIIKNDILYYSVGANLGFCHNYLADEQIAVGSFINIIRPDSSKINEIYLGVVLNSLIGRLQAEREKSGMAQPYIYAKSLREFKIPIISIEKQMEIAQYIVNGFILKKQSVQLLENAKQAVEIAIEENEDEALKYIESLEI